MRSYLIFPWNERLKGCTRRVSGAHTRVRLWRDTGGAVRLWRDRGGAVRLWRDTGGAVRLWRNTGGAVRLWRDRGKHYLRTMPYLITVPPLLRKFYGDVLWEMPANERAVYLTFDDGPHPSETPFVLEQLAKYKANATFFCIGKNVAEHPAVYQNILSEGHAVGNHTFHHLDGWKTASKNYYLDIERAATLIGSQLFRPPYGKVTGRQVKELEKRGLRTVMWSVISGDFDKSINQEKCAGNVIKHAKPGAIIVFHDSTKASANLRGALPLVLEKLSGEGYRFKSLL